ncbi:MAG: hypothetical protein HN802_02845 [Candidatus Jacksonbacteria bacterium]|nr:hypothetical protein [Candidatus Jacksonbacteria bacterium]MBT7338612.1 hypothetical protein [Candidatus Jacksonbacteria bacterium]
MRRNIAALMLVMCALGAYAVEATETEEDSHPTIRLEVQNLVTSNDGKVEYTPWYIGYVRKELSPKFRFTTSLVSSDNWGAGFVGVIWTPRPWLELDAAVALEVADIPLRSEASVWFQREKVEGFALAEYGGSGFWSKAALQWRFTENVSVGPFTQRFVGNGLRVDIKRILTPGTGLWVVGFPNNRVLFAIRHTL